MLQLAGLGTWFRFAGEGISAGHDPPDTSPRRFELS